MPPRGGRGGGGRRGGPPKPGFTRIGGMEIAYDADTQPEKDGRPQPSKTFPEFPHGGQPPQPRPPSARERQQLAFQSHLRSLIRRSPLYTTFSGDSVPSSSTMYSSRFGPGATISRLTSHQRGSKRPATASAATVDPFNVMPHYSDRYDQKRRKMPRLDRQKVRVVLNFFPEELHGLLDPTSATKGANGTAQLRVKRERDSLDTNEIEAAEADEAEASGATADEDEDVRDRAKDRKNRKISVEEGEDVEEGEEEVGEDGQTGVGDEGEIDEQDEDDDFEGDEEELAGDYNAEGYFDDGGDDAGDDDMDDGGGGGDYD